MKLVSMLVEIRCNKESEKTWFASMPVREAFELIYMEGFAGMVVKMVPEYELSEMPKE